MTDANESGQLDLIDALADRLDAAEDGVQSLLDLLNPAIEANPNDNLLMDLYGYVTDADRSFKAIHDLLTTMRQRDEQES